MSALRFVAWRGAFVCLSLACSFWGSSQEREVFMRRWRCEAAIRWLGLTVSFQKSVRTDDLAGYLGKIYCAWFSMFPAWTVAIRERLTCVVNVLSGMSVMAGTHLRSLWSTTCYYRSEFKIFTGQYDVYIGTTDICILTLVTSGKLGLYWTRVYWSELIVDV